MPERISGLRDSAFTAYCLTRAAIEVGAAEAGRAVQRHLAVRTAAQPPRSIADAVTVSDAEKSALAVDATDDYARSDLSRDLLLLRDSRPDRSSLLFAAQIARRLMANPTLSSAIPDWMVIFLLDRATAGFRQGAMLFNDDTGPALAALLDQIVPAALFGSEGENRLTQLLRLFHQPPSWFARTDAKPHFQETADRHPLNAGAKLLQVMDRLATGMLRSGLVRSYADWRDCRMIGTLLAEHGGRGNTDDSASYNAELRIYDPDNGMLLRYQSRADDWEMLDVYPPSLPDLIAVMPVVVNAAEMFGHVLQDCHPADAPIAMRPLHALFGTIEALPPADRAPALDHALHYAARHDAADRVTLLPLLAAQINAAATDDPDPRRRARRQAGLIDQVMDQLPALEHEPAPIAICRLLAEQLWEAATMRDPDAWGNLAESVAESGLPELSHVLQRLDAAIAAMPGPARSATELLAEEPG